MKPLITETSVSYEIQGEFGLFTDPVSKAGGEKNTYLLPTYGALREITRALYWKPTFNWIIDAVRIMNPINTEIHGQKLISYNDDKASDRAIYNMLRKPRYQVLAHFEWDMEQVNLQKDRNLKKHLEMTNRKIKDGAYKQPHFGVSMCPADAYPMEFGEGPGAYDNIPNMDFGRMFHSMVYPTLTSDLNIRSTFWTPKVENGVIHFVRPDDPAIESKIIRKGKRPILRTEVAK